MSSTEQVVSAVQAAWLVDVSPNTIRTWINSGKLPAEKVQPVGQPATWAIRLDDLANIPGVLIDQERLRAMAMPEMAARLERRLLEIEQRLAASEERDARNDERIKALVTQVALLQEVAAPAATPPAALPAPRIARVRAALTPADAVLDDYLPERYPNTQMRSNFLANHGWSRTVTAEWHDECPWGPPEAVLRWALERDARIGWRATTRNRKVHPCGVPDCPCHQLFASLSRADEQPY